VQQAVRQLGLERVAGPRPGRSNHVRAPSRRSCPRRERPLIERSRVWKSSSPRKYFCATMLVAFGTRSKGTRRRAARRRCRCARRGARTRRSQTDATPGWANRRRTLQRLAGADSHVADPAHQPHRSRRGIWEPPARLDRGDAGGGGGGVRGRVMMGATVSKLRTLAREPRSGECVCGAPTPR
jgi:hypothetical protein